MWHTNLIEIVKKSKLTPKQIAEKGDLSERTVIRVLNQNTNSCHLDTLECFARALNCSLDDIILDSNVVVGNANFDALQKECDLLKAEKELLITENTILKDEKKDLNVEIEILKLKLLHAEELLAVHNYYNKLK